MQYSSSSATTTVTVQGGADSGRSPAKNFVLPKYMIYIIVSTAAAFVFAVGICLVVVVVYNKSRSKGLYRKPSFSIYSVKMSMSF